MQIAECYEDIRNEDIEMTRNVTLEGRNKRLFVTLVEKPVQNWQYGKVIRVLRVHSVMDNRKRSLELELD
jgi:hypothetical protein